MVTDLCAANGEVATSWWMIYGPYLLQPSTCTGDSDYHLGDSPSSHRKHIARQNCRTVRVTFCRDKRARSSERSAGITCAVYESRVAGVELEMSSTISHEPSA